MCAMRPARARGIDIRQTLYATWPARGSCLRFIDSCITQPKAQGLARTCNERKEEEAVFEKAWWQAAKGFNPATNINPHHGNIKDKQFGVQVRSR